MQMESIKATLQQSVTRSFEGLVIVSVLQMKKQTQEGAPGQAAKEGGESTNSLSLSDEVCVPSITWPIPRAQNAPET